MADSMNTIAIIGANGKTGFRVEKRLQALGCATRPVSRSTSISFDWKNRETWYNALKGARQAYISYQPDLAVPNAESDIAHFVQLARKCGLEHLVLLSGRGEEGAQRAEAILEQSGLSWNIVRASWFYQNFSESFMLEGILSGELILPVGDIPEPFIDVDDIADVVVECITNPEHRNKLFEVTGPHALTFAEAVAMISDAIGRPIKFSQIPVQNFLSALKEGGEPEEMQWLMNELFTVVLDGRNKEVRYGVSEALGRPATDFNDYLQKVIESGVWSQLSVEEAGQ